ncbi:MAG: FAD-binding protein, partial [Hansschlegelia sp.]
AIDSRRALGGHLADDRWSHRVLDATFDGMNELAERGYPFPRDEETGSSIRVSLQGPDYMRLMRKLAKSAGVRILDHSPALELLVGPDGAAAGARGVRRQKGDDWIVRSGAVVIATGGCAFLSRALGTNVLTGDGHLMAAEIGAEFSGMEFSNAYGLSPAFSSVTKSAFYKWATFTDEAGDPIPGAASQGGRSVIARALEKGPVFGRLDKADEPIRRAMRASQPNFFLPFDRRGLDPFNDRFAITLRLEGTVRGTGGLRIVDDSCATTVPGLYAAGDAATRELICGGFTGGGSHNAAWAISSGRWAGAGAAEFSRGRDRAGELRSTGGAALGDGGGRAFDPAAAVQAVQADTFSFQTNYFRHPDRLTLALERLDEQWRTMRRGGPASREDVVRAREAAAMTAVARWMYRSGLARDETRGMHRREDRPGTDDRLRRHLFTGGLDDVQARFGGALAQTEEVAA